MISEKLVTDVYAFYDKNANELNTVGDVAATVGGLIVELSRKLSNNKPILFALNTSLHGDHWYGNIYLPSTTLIIQYIHAKQYSDEHLEHDKQFMIQNFDQGHGMEEIELHDDLFIWESQSKVLWTGNPIVSLPSDARIIPGHDVMIKREGLQ